MLRCLELNSPWWQMRSYPGMLKRRYKVFPISRDNVREGLLLTLNTCINIVCLFVWNYSWAWPMDSYQTFKLRILVLLESRRKHIPQVYPWNTWNLFSMVFLNFIVVITFNNSFLKTKTQQVKRNPLELLTFPYFDLNKAKLFSSCIIIHFYVSIPLFLFPSEMSFSVFFTGLIFTCHLKIL